MHKKLAPEHFILVNNAEQPLHGRNSFKGKIFERKLSKSKICFFFRTQSLSMIKIMNIKRDLELVTSHSSDYKTSSEKFLY